MRQVHDKTDHVTDFSSLQSEAIAADDTAAVTAAMSSGLCNGPSPSRKHHPASPPHPTVKSKGSGQEEEGWQNPLLQNVLSTHIDNVIYD